MLLTTGMVFQAENKLGRKYFYMFYGVETESNTGCDYIHLRNLNYGSMTCVERQWFSERKLTEIKPGMKVKNGGEYGRIRQLNVTLNELCMQVVLDDYITKDLWAYKDIELV